ncbi:MAG: DUF493 domain-containing protein [Campylobacter sp.]|nr:DUF493 domain-containing protein [Campylobacter sp.]
MASICEFNKKPKIDYPNFWSYRVIGDGNLREDISRVIGDFEYEISFSKHSKAGRYQSFEVSVLVHSDTQRVSVFEELKKIAKFVL